MNRWLRIAAVLTLIALALMTWSLLEPTWLPIIIAMSVAQAFGTAAFGIYGWVVFRDLTRKRADRRSQENLRLSQELALERDRSRRASEPPVAPRVSARRASRSDRIPSEPAASAREPSEPAASSEPAAAQERSEPAASSEPARSGEEAPSPSEEKVAKTGGDGS